MFSSKKKKKEKNDCYGVWQRHGQSRRTQEPIDVILKNSTPTKPIDVIEKNSTKPIDVIYKNSTNPSM